MNNALFRLIFTIQKVAERPVGWTLQRTAFKCHCNFQAQVLAGKSSILVNSGGIKQSFPLSSCLKMSVIFPFLPLPPLFFGKNMALFLIYIYMCIFKFHPISSTFWLCVVLRYALISFSVMPLTILMTIIPLLFISQAIITIFACLFFINTKLSELNQNVNTSILKMVMIYC